MILKYLITFSYISVYHSPHSRKDILHSLAAPHEGDEEIIFPSNLIPSYMFQNKGKINKKLVKINGFVLHDN